MVARHRASIVVAVALGGALGTVARYEVALAEPVSSGRFPWATFAVNLVGSFVLGLAVVLLGDTRPSTALGRAFVTVRIRSVKASTLCERTSTL